MAMNVEIKARVADLDRLAAIAASICDSGPIDIHQDDTFFNCSQGRLKLRVFDDQTGELIFYKRSDESGPKASFYVRSKTSEPDALREILNLAHGTVGRVIKKRLLFLTGRTRIHLDDVRGLGIFMELEVVLRDGDSVEDGVQEARRLMERLQIDERDLIETAYVDLLVRQN